MSAEARPRDKSYRNVGLIVAISLLLGIFFDYFFYEKDLGLSFPLYTVSVLLGVYATIKFNDMKIEKSTAFLIIPLLFFSSMVFLRDSELLTFLNVVMSLYFLLLLLLNHTLNHKIQNYTLIDHFFTLFVLPIKIAEKFFSGIGEFFSVFSFLRKERNLTPIFRGILISIPVLFLFILLFSSADLVFNKYLNEIFDLDLDPETFSRLTVILFITSMFMGAFNYMIKPIDWKMAREENANQNVYQLGLTETSILLGSVNLLFIMFILVQLTYIFGGESNIVNQGFTYAEYARKGFFELIAVAVFSFFLIWIVEKYVFRRGGIHTVLFKVLGSALTIEVMVIMASAFKRLLLYENAYGFTVLRLYSHIFIIWLAVIFLFLFVKIVFDQQESSFVAQAFAIIVVFLVFMNVVNLEAFIARRNIEQYLTTGKLDAIYLSKLSSDALPESIKVLDLKGGDFKSEFSRALDIKRQNLVRAKNQGQWQSSNYSRQRAIGILNSKASQLQKNKEMR